MQQQTATADVLKVISSSPGELEPVFQAMLENAVRICAAKFGSLVLFEDNAYRRVALHNAPTAFVEAQAREPVRPLAASPTLSRIAETKQIICYADILAEQPEEAIASLGGARAVLCVPMLKDDRAVGAISIYRQEVRPFSDKQMEVLTNFAAQAVIAIENTRLLKELRESLQQQTATADVLKVISSSPGELQPVFEAMLENATRICEAKFGILWLREGDAYRLGALHGAPPAFAEARWREPVVHPGPRTALARIELTKQAVHIADLRADPAYLERDPLGVAAVEIAGSRTFLAVPMFKESEIVGAIVIYRQEVRPFTDKQIELVKNFAAQAVIAIENTRLLSELRQRTDDLSEALEQQTATSEVLQVISSSPGELEPVFQAMLENATRICEAKFGVMYRYEHDAFYPAAMLNAPPRYADFVWARGRFLPQSGNALDLVFQTKQVIHSVDQSKERVPTPSAKLGGARSQVTVPMLKDGSLVGAIAVYRQEVRPFTDKQIELVQNFAAQAVIAIENTRLLNELRESLQQQTATADVLKVISSSPGELEPVFDAMLENATRICEAKFGTLYLGDEGGITLVASHNVPEAYAEIRRGKVHNPASGTALGEVIRTKQTAHVADLAATRSYTERNPGTVQAVEVGGIRTSVSVPLLKDDELIGLIGIYRQEVRPFTDKQIALLTNFAAQAVIAIENTRLLSELRESLQQQTATADVLKVISSSPGELQPVFQALLENATRICEAKLGTLFLSEGDGFRTAALHGAPLGWAELRQRDPVVRPGPKNPLGRVARTKHLQHIADITKEAAYVDREPEFVPLAEVAGARTLLIVPMIKENELVGAIGIYRQEVRPFTDKQVELVQNFAAQAVIAIENTRLLKELRQRTNDLSESLEQQTATSEVLGVISRSTGDLAPVFASILGNATRICEANFGGLFLSEGVGFRSVAQQGPLLDWWKQDPLLDVRRHPGLPLSRIARSKSVVHVADLAAEVASHADDPRFVALVKTAGARTVLGVPMLKDDDLVGAIIIYRSDVRPFSDKQIELVQNFASQAIIAIENARLLNELRQSTAELTKSLENLRTTQDRLVQTQKLASLGQLTAGIAHEIKNPLNFVNNFSGVSAELIDELREALSDVKSQRKAAR